MHLFFIFLVFSYEHITPKSVFMLNCFLIYNFTSKFKSTRWATLHTILIDRHAFCSTRAYRLIRRLVMIIQEMVCAILPTAYVAQQLSYIEELQLSSHVNKYLKWVTIEHTKWAVFGVISSNYLSCLTI